MSQTNEGGWKDFKQYYSRALFVLGVIPSTLSVVSVLKEMLEFGLYHLFARFLQYYRDLVYPIVELIPIDMPDWYKDLYVIGLVISLLVLRTIDGIVILWDKPELVWRWRVLGFIACLVIPLTLIPIAFFAVTLPLVFLRGIPIVRNGPVHFNTLQITSAIHLVGWFLAKFFYTYTMLVLSIAAALVVFFVLNAALK